MNPVRLSLRYPQVTIALTVMLVASGAYAVMPWSGIVRAIDARRPEAYLPAVWGAIMPLIKRVPEGLFQRLPFLSGR